ncbi:hypothetical protein OG455_27590 [Kitasatospora sp. NBC_01287]|uniref:hypothetical protein n=1 Tax=Kitasatospora sp. NBC_01287 TaxID=2903573 RepID=UPI0022590985|nr:hypothetical protein [Kitasatospora sp. NBC_01287]MCX4749224.1 hypothetical protein [Kitasatospora sp. NBC_01287]
MDTSTDQNPRPVRIVASGPSATVEIDGRDVAKEIVGYRLAQAAGELPELLLRPQAVDDWEGLARIVAGEVPDPGPAAAAFLQAIDPGETGALSVVRTTWMRIDKVGGAA